jgi:adenylate cyclase
LAAAARIPGPEWSAFVEQPTAEAYGPIRAALWRTGLLLIAGSAFALALAYLLAVRMAGPIRQLEEGAPRASALGVSIIRSTCAPATN